MNGEFVGRLGLVLILLGSASAYSQDLERHELQGPVKSMTVKSFHAEQNGKDLVKTAPGVFGEDILYEDRRYDFDTTGNLLLVTILTEDGNEETEERYTYENGLLVHHFAFYGEMDYTYDANGVLIETLSYEGGTEARQVYTNANGKPVEVFTISIDGDTTDHELVEHDANGNVVRWYSVPVNGWDFYRYETTCTYDAEGHCTSYALLTDITHRKIETTYKNGRIAEETESYYQNGMLVHYEEKRYEQHGLPAEKKIYAPVDPFDVQQLEISHTLTYAYRFDKKGNWTEQVTTVSTSAGKEYYIAERAITYF